MGRAGATEVAQKACLLEGLTQLLAVTPGNFAVILHSDPDCANLVWRDFRAHDPTRFFCTNLQERDVLAGNSGSILAEAIEEVDSERDPEAIFVIGSCVTSMLADDIEQIVTGVADSVSAPIVPIHNHAFRLYGQAHILDTFTWLMWQMGRTKSDKARSSVNLLGYPEDGGEMARILGKLGLCVNAAPGIGDSPDSFGALGSGLLNVVSDKRLYARVLTDMQENLQIPQLELAPPVGLRATQNFWSDLAHRLDLSDQAAEVIEPLAAEAREARDRAREAFAGSRLGYHVAGRKDFSLPVVVREGLMYVDLFTDLGFEVVLLFQGAVEGGARQKVEAMLESQGLDLPFVPLRDRVAVTRAISENRLDAIHCSESLREEVERAEVPLIRIGSMRPGFDGIVHNIESLLALAGVEGGGS